MIGIPYAQEQTIDRDSVRWKNEQALSDIMREYSLTIPAHDFKNWRPTLRVSGSIPGVAPHVTIIATNGILGYFVYEDITVPVLCGHIQCFDGKVEPLFSAAKQPRGQRRDEVYLKKNASCEEVKQPRRTLVERALDALKEFKRKE